MCEFQLKFLQSEVEFKSVAKQGDIECLQGFFYFLPIFCNFLPIHPANFFLFYLYQVYPKHSSSFLCKHQHFICHTHISSIKVYLKFIISMIMLTGLNTFRNEHKWFLAMIQLKWYKQAFEQGFECAMDNFCIVYRVDLLRVS